MTRHRNRRDEKKAQLQRRKQRPTPDDLDLSGVDKPVSNNAISAQLLKAHAHVSSGVRRSINWSPEFSGPQTETYFVATVDTGSAAIVLTLLIALDDSRKREREEEKVAGIGWEKETFRPTASPLLVVVSPRKWLWPGAVVELHCDTVGAFVSPMSSEL